MDGLDLSLDSLQFAGFKLQGQVQEDGDDDLPTESEFIVVPWWKKVFCCWNWSEWFITIPDTVPGFKSDFELLENDLFDDDLEVPRTPNECMALAKQESDNSLL